MSNVSPTLGFLTVSLKTALCPRPSRATGAAFLGVGARLAVADR